MSFLKTHRLFIYIGIGIIAACVLISEDTGLPTSTVKLTNTLASQSTSHTETIVQVEPVTAHIDPVEQAIDLRALFEQNKASESPVKLKLAYRAWRICVPNFIGTQSTSLAREMHERPDNDERRIAYRKLRDRCKNFSDLTDEQLAIQSAYQNQLWLSGKTKTPGELATSLLKTGDFDAALQIAKTVMESRDLNAVESLRGFYSAYWRDQHGGDEELATFDEIRASAYTVAACQTGLECGPNSIMAIEHCIYTGQCTGGIVERYLSSLPQQSERETLLAESKIIIGQMHAP